MAYNNLFLWKISDMSLNNITKQLEN